MGGPESAEGRAYSLRSGNSSAERVENLVAENLAVLHAAALSTGFDRIEVVFSASDHALHPRELGAA